MKRDELYLIKYREEIRAGRIIAGRELITELDKLIEDLDDERYIYDPFEAHMRIEFDENLCLQSRKPFYMMPVKLVLWQKAFFEVLYSFKRRETGFRRFQEALLLVARKNGKTTMLATDGHADLRLGDGGQDICCYSNDDKQASLLWKEIKSMANKIDPNEKIVHSNLAEIKNIKKGTTIFKMSGKTQNKDGRIMDKTYCDEGHEAKDNEGPEACKQSMSTKDEPLFIDLTTEGFINDGYLDERLKYARKVLNDEIDDDTFLPWLYTQDSEQEIWQDKNSWYKSNPSLGVTKKWSYIEKRIELAKTDKATRMTTLCKDFNIKQSNASAWLMREDYDYPATFNIEDFKNCVCLGAVDLAETTDLCSAKIMMMKPNDNTKYVYSHYFIPESKLLEAPDTTSGANYKEWARDGYLTILPGNDVDVSKIADWFADLFKQYKIRLYKCGYDQKFAKEFTKRMDSYNFEYEMIIQNKLVLSNPMKLTESDLKHRVINYNQHPIDKWCLGNSSMEIDNLGNVMAVKINNQRERRIDGAVTLIMLEEMFRRYRTEIKGVWDRAK